jgi:hypothetical protein
VTASRTTRITPQDLQNKLQAFQDGLQGKVDEKRNTLVSAGATAGLLLLLIFFLLGKRSGKRKTTIVEIKRV